MLCELLPCICHAPAERIAEAFQGLDPNRELSHVLDDNTPKGTGIASHQPSKTICGLSRYSSDRIYVKWHRPNENRLPNSKPKCQHCMRMLAAGLGKPYLGE